MSFGLKLFDILTANATAAKSYINRMLAKKQDKLTFDSAPTAGSSNPVTSDGIRKAIDTATPNVDFSNYPTKDGTGATGTWPISISGAATKASQDSNGKVIADTYATKTALGAKQDKLTFDATPTENSTNPVTSDGIKKAIDISSADNVQYEKLDGHAINSIIKAGKIVPPSEKLQFNPPTPGIVFEEQNSNIKYGSVDIRALGEGNGKISFSFYEPGAVELSSYTLDEYGNFSGNANTVSNVSSSFMNLKAVSVPSDAKSNYNIAPIASGTIDSLDDLVGKTNADLTDLSKNRSFVGSVYAKSTDKWYDVFTIRHRNGASDGSNYGMLFYSDMLSSADGLHYKKQYNGTGAWSEERTLLDSSNYGNYALPKSGGTMTGALNFANATKNVVGDNVAMGDFNKPGTLGIQGVNGNSSVMLIKSGVGWGAGSEGAVMTYNGATQSLDFNFQ